MNPAVLVECRDAVGVITLNRPDQGNAYTHQMGLELNEALIALDGDDLVRAIVVTGAGKHFCVGADLDPNADNRLAWLRRSELDRVQAEPPLCRPWRLGTPIIGALNGAAVGVGLTLPLQWDIRVAALDGKLGFPFTRRGVIPEANSTWLLSRLVGGTRALDLLLTGRMFSGLQAEAMGVVSHAVAADVVLETALDIARDLAENVSPAAAGTTKRLIYEFLRSGDRDAALKTERGLFEELARGPDASEGGRAFLEKRAPVWRSDKHGLEPAH